MYLFKNWPTLRGPKHPQSTSSYSLHTAPNCYFGMSLYSLYKLASRHLCWRLLLFTRSLFREFIRVCDQSRIWYQFVPHEYFGKWKTTKRGVICWRSLLSLNFILTRLQRCPRLRLTSNRTWFQQTRHHPSRSPSPEPLAVHLALREISGSEEGPLRGICEELHC